MCRTRRLLRSQSASRLRARLPTPVATYRAAGVGTSNRHHAGDEHMADGNMVRRVGHSDRSDDAIAAQRVEFVSRDTKALEYFVGVFAEVGDMRRNFIAAQAGHFNGRAENLDVVMAGDGAVADDVTRG